MAFKKVGVVPDGGAIFFLTQHLGIARAKELVYTARAVAADEAKDLGLVSRVVPDAELEAASTGTGHARFAGIGDLRTGAGQENVPVHVRADAGAALRNGNPRLRHRAPDARPQGRRGGVQGKAPAEVRGQVGHAQRVMTTKTAHTIPRRPVAVPEPARELRSSAYRMTRPALAARR